MSLLVIGLNHKTASIDIREKISIAENRLSKVVSDFCKIESIKSCVVLSTCNRTEFYLSCSNLENTRNHFYSWCDLPNKNIQNCFYDKTSIDCIEHLFEVASGLDSMVLGESQILGQVKAAYDTSKKLDKLDKTLGRLFQTAFRVAKSVRSNTDIGKNPVSVANSAVQLSKQIFGDLSQQNILLIGAGETTELLGRYIDKLEYKNLTICNRTLKNAELLAQQFKADTFELKQLRHKISNFDLVFTATSSESIIIDKGMLQNAIKQRKHRPMVIIDLAVPRDVDELVKKFNDIFYYSVDDLQKVISQNLQSREDAAISAKEIIKAEALSFKYWLKGQVHTKLIHNFQKETARIRQESLDKALKQLSKGTDIEDVLYYLANNLTNKLNHAPVKAIRKAIQSGDMNKIDNIIELLDLTDDSRN